MKHFLRPPVNFLHLTLYLFYSNQMHTFYYIPCFPYMFRCISHHLQGYRTCFLLKNTRCYAGILYGTVVAS